MAKWVGGRMPADSLSWLTDGHHAEVAGPYPWTLFRYQIKFGQGPMEIQPYSYALTARGARRKALRMIRRLDRVAAVRVVTIEPVIAPATPDPER
jgi:hypothetical protein